MANGPVILMTCCPEKGHVCRDFELVSVCSIHILHTDIYMLSVHISIVIPAIADHVFMGMNAKSRHREEYCILVSVVESGPALQH